MKPNLLAQIDFNQIINQVFPAPGLPSKINPGNINLKLGDIISAFLPYIFVFSGLMLFLFIIFGGFQLLASGGNPESVKSGQGKVTGALIGFIIIFVAYWLVEILQIVFGIDILR